MIIVGLTGGIGAGKSFVAKEFLKRGIPVYNSDTRAKDLMESNQVIKEALIRKFGSTTYIDNKLNRKLIADKIFTNKDLISWINNLVHPIVQDDFEQWVANQKSPFIIKEAAILIESGAYKQCHKIIVVTAPLNEKIKRVTERDNMTPEQIKERMNNQMSEAELLQYADFTITNDGIKLVEKQVQTIYNDILKLK